MSKFLRKFKTNRPLGPSCQKVSEYIFAHPDESQEQVAKACGISKARVSQIVNHPRVIAMYPVMARRRVNSTLIAKATQAYEELIDQKESLPTREKAAARVLTETKVLAAPEQTVVHRLELAPIDELRRIVGDARQVPDNTVDAEVIETDSDKAI